MMRTNHILLEISLRVEVIRFVRVKAYKRFRFGKIERVRHSALISPLFFISIGVHKRRENAHFPEKVDRIQGVIMSIY